MEVLHDNLKAKNKFYLVDNNKEIAEMSYVFIKNNIIDINHTFIDKAHRGQDLGLKLIAEAVKFMRENDIKAVATCPYVKKIFDESTKYQDVVMSN